jgi:sulfite reductase (ferredoxin)
MLSCPLEGVAADAIADATAPLAEIVENYLGDPAFSNLPRKYKTAISGCAAQCVNHELNDISFVGVRRDDGEVGFDLWVGGGLSTNPMLAQRLGTFVEPDLVPEVWAGVTGLFRDYGYRRLRSRARMKFLVADWGTEKFREVLQEEYLKRKLPDGPAPPPPRDGARDHVGVHEQQDGRYSVGFAPRVGRTSGTQLREIADLADRYGVGRVRATVDQKMVIVDVPEDDVAVLVTELEERDLQVRPSAFRRGTIACTGIEFCKLAIVETKARGAALIDELERRLPDFDEPIGININGCPNSCSRVQTDDIGFKGQLVTGPDGEQTEGFQVHLGGSLGTTAGFGRKVRGLKVTADELPDYIERVLKRFQAEREDGERFAAWAARASEEELS